MASPAGARVMTEWTIDDVAARFADAAQTAHRLPKVRVQGYFNSWSMFACHIPDRYPDPDRLYRPMPPTPKAVELMLETMTWVQWLEVEQRHLVWMRADRYEWQQIGRRFACDRNTASRRWQKAIEVVAARLNSHTETSRQTTPLSGTIRK